MGALPKQKITRRRRGNRRAHQALKVPQLQPCPNCGALAPSHVVCQACGYYRGTDVAGLDRPNLKYR